MRPSVTCDEGENLTEIVLSHVTRSAVRWPGSVFQVGVKKVEVDQNVYMNTKNMTQWGPGGRVFRDCGHRLIGPRPSQSESYPACLTNHTIDLEEERFWELTIEKKMIFIYFYIYYMHYICVCYYVGVYKVYVHLHNLKSIWFDLWMKEVIFYLEYEMLFRS